ncbi:MAG: CRISPR-associated endonuclease Cas3'' [Lentisphaeria bacterium]|nr:CRISPR-associated endonuclease Cas3'' [Lentisphaeria bacterium]
MKYAHSLKDRSVEQWQSLDGHLQNVSCLAGKFASDFSSTEHAELLGLLHDIGKSRKSFERYLLYCNGIDDHDYDYSDHRHSGAGACWLNQYPAGKWLAYCAAGHHSGLTDGNSLKFRLQEEKSVLAESDVQAWIAERETDWKKRINALKAPWNQFQPKDISFWLRMLYSCLVDADFLDTENFMTPDQTAERGGFLSLPELSERFFCYLNDKQANAEKTPVNRIRGEIRDACEKAAEQAPGIFSLTVPTGGGKTLSGMAFAFLHALKHRKKRIIYVIPYTSIIEQTSAVMREILGDENVVEHHSNFDPEKETLRSSLASENWDAPVIITTTVQFFESLYSNKPSRCRKIHNIPDSVVILDEVQLLPVHLLAPCYEAISQLAEHYKTTFVLSTATQPDIGRLGNVCEIIPPEMDLFRRLKRTEVLFPEDLLMRNSWDDIAAELLKYQQVLCIVNTRADCKTLWEKLPEDTVHLSASMCGNHRTKVIAEIKEKLKSGENIRVVATTLVEAGVDIDFPVVFRAYTGLASVMQSAGRCNREGKMKDPGKTIVFIPPEPSPIEELRNAETAMTDLLALKKNIEDPEIYPLFFEMFHSKCNDTGKDFHRMLVKHVIGWEIAFAEAAEKFRMIDDQHSLPLIVRYGGNSKLLEALKYSHPDRILMRKLQRSTVNIPRQVMAEFLKNGMVEEMFPGIFVQKEDTILYSEKFGVNIK